MPFDLSQARQILGHLTTADIEARAVNNVRTILDTSDAFDAHLMGYDGPRDPVEDAEGLRVTWDGRWSIPSVILNGPDGQISIDGLCAIEAALDALMKAASYARKMKAAA